VAARGRLMQELPAGGAMLVVAASESQVLEWLAADQAGSVAVAGVNGPESVVVSGEAAGVERLAELWAARGVKVSRLRVSHAFHSHLMDPMLSQLFEVAEQLVLGEPMVPVVSTLTGQVVEPGLLCSGEYWVRQAREAVRFADAVRTLRDQGAQVFVELGPDAVVFVFDPNGGRGGGDLKTEGRGFVAGFAAVDPFEGALPDVGGGGLR